MKCTVCCDYISILTYELLHINGACEVASLWSKM